MATIQSGPGGGLHTVETFASRTVATVNGIPSIIPAGSSRVTDPDGAQRIVDAGTLANHYSASETLPIQAASGAPATTPSAGTLYFDTVANKLWCYNGAAWKGVVLA